VTSKIDLLVEAERRGILPENKKALLAEARRRGLVGEDSRADWTPEMRESYEGRKQLRERMGEPGHARRAIHSLTLGGSDELAAGLQTIIETPFKRGSFGDRFNENWAAEQADLDTMRENTGGAAGVAADVAGGMAMGVPRMIAGSALRAPTFWEGAKEAVKTGAKYGPAFAAGHAFLDTEGDVGDRLAEVPEAAAEGLVAGPAIALGLHTGLSGVQAVRAAGARRAQARADRTAPIVDDFRESGVPEFSPALSDSGLVEGTATGLAGTVFGSSLRSGARQSIEALEGRIQDELAAAGGVRTPAEAGEQQQSFLRRQLTERSVPKETVDTMSREQLQDISGVAPDPGYKPEPVKVQPVAPKPVTPITPDAYLNTVREGVPPVAPKYPPDEQLRPVRMEDFRQPDAAPRVNAEIEARRAELDQMKARFEPEARAFAEEQTKLADDIERAGFEVDEWSSHGNFALRPRGFLNSKVSEPLEYWPNGQPDASTESGYRRAAAKFASRGFRGENQAREYLKAADRIAEDRRLTDQLAARFAQVRNRSAAIGKAKNQIAAMEREIAQAEAKAAERIAKERSASEEKQRENYIKAVEAENERVRLANEQARIMADDAALAETERLRNEAVEAVRPTAEQGAAARTRQLERQAQEDARKETARLQAEAEAKQAQDLAERRARASEPFVPGRSGESYPTEFDAAYRAVDLNTPKIQRNALGARETKSNPSTGTNTTALLESIAAEARSAGKLPGYKGQIFDENGRIRQDLIDYLRPRLGDEVTDHLVYLSDRRASHQFAPAVRGMHLNRTEIGREMADAGRAGQPGAPRGADEAMLARFYKAYNDDIVAAREAGGGHISARQRSEVDRGYQEYLGLRSSLAKVFGENINPVQAIDTLVKTTQRGGNIDQLRAFYRVVDDKGDRLTATGALLHRMAEGGLEGFLKSYRSLSPDARRVMFQGASQEFGQALDRLARVGGRLEAYTNVARDGYNIDVTRLARPGNIVFGLLGYLNIPVAIQSAIGAEAAARLLASKRFGQWLKGASNLIDKGPQSVEWKRHVYRLGVISQELLGLREGQLAGLVDGMIEGGR